VLWTRKLLSRSIDPKRAVCQPLPVAAEQGVGRFARRGRQQTLARAARQVVGQAQRPGSLRADDAAELFEERVGVDITQRHGGRAVAVEPDLEGAEAELSAGRHTKGFDEFAQAQEVGLLVRVLVAVGVIQRSGVALAAGKVAGSEVGSRSILASSTGAPRRKRDLS